MVTTTSERFTENHKDSDNEESSGEKKVEIEKVPQTPPEREVVKKVEKEELCVVPPPYKSPIPFPQRSVEVKVDPKSERKEELSENIHTNAPLFATLNKKREFEAHEIRELISIKRGKPDFEVVFSKIEPKPEKLALRIEPEPPPQTPLGPFPEKHTDMVTTTSERFTENHKDSDNEESSGEKKVEIEKVPQTPPEREVVKKVEKEELCVVPPPYKSPIPFPQRSVEVKVDPKSERKEELSENIHTNAPLFATLNKKREFEAHEIRELISIKRGKPDFEVVFSKIEPKPEKLALRIEPEPPPQYLLEFIELLTFIMQPVDTIFRGSVQRRRYDYLAQKDMALTIYYGPTMDKLGI
ncbi:uncharacterized protein LOC127080015 [Lathyrus oleraceus]|uniref:uncharacterized protein LOC127080015 n=1 Tax=Pisum sativum TaxID=3888 RepID=UPI0021CE83AF|nr:uncharacterized protein LOC127080015 [Pisum sativum]